MLITDQHPHNRSIMTTVIGKPNAGKSSLVNYLLGVDLSIVTPKAQTTRNSFHCVLTVDRTEIVLVDTPGLHQNNLEINLRMNDMAAESVEGVNVILMLVDLTRDVVFELQDLSKKITTTIPIWLVFTHQDLVPNPAKRVTDELIEKCKVIFPTIEKHFIVSSVTGEGMHLLTGALCDRSQNLPHLYPGGDISNKNMRFFASEYIREQAFLLLRDEIPYELTVVIEDYKDVKEGEGENAVTRTYISAGILVNRQSQRGIVVGKGGALIKEIGSKAREKIEKIVGNQVHLNLHVKVSPNWFKNNYVLEEMGLPRGIGNSHRVWRKH
ncbi:MAG: GTPase Era [Bacteriovoracaceae bacterium]